MSWAQCNSWHKATNAKENRVQNALDEPKPWIGLYIAAASAVCGIAMAFDVINGLKTKKLWFPCKYFSLNATSLTLLSVAMKLTMDLTSSKFDDVAGTIASYSSFVLMLNAMGNFMTSLPSMDDKDTMLNLTALGILVITVVINQGIFTVQTHKTTALSSMILNGRVYKCPFELRFEDFVSVALLLLLILLCTSAIIAPTTKRYVETKFSELHKMVLNEKVHDTKYTAQQLREVLKKYWIMAGTGNPQFVLARSVICVIPSVICLSMTLKFYNNIHYYGYGALHSNSTYKWSLGWIFIIQTVGAVIGTVASTSRLFIAAWCRSSRAGHTSFKMELTTETYWIQRLIDWRESPTPLRVRHFKIKKILHVSKKVLLNIFIIVQIFIVLTSKLILIIPSWFINVIFKFIHNVNKLRRYVFKLTSDGTHELDFTPYVMLLEGELKLPNWIIANICNEADKLIQVGMMQKPNNIIELLHKSKNFNGVSDFDKKNITSLHTQGSHSCWSLSLATLTSIAVAPSNIPSDLVNKLFNTVSEGLQFVKFIENFFDNGGKMVRIRKTADIVWERLELDQKWQHKHVAKGNNSSDQTYNAKLIELSTKAKKTVMDFKTNTADSVMDNPLNWPVEVIAANSMYRVCESLLLIEMDGTKDKLDQIFFERLSITIADILAACLTNLAHVIYKECYISSVEKRQESTRCALILLGESEEIIHYLEQREWPNLDPDKAGYIEEWQAIMEPGNEIPVNSVSTTDDSSAPQSSNEHVVINVGSSF